MPKILPKSNNILPNKKFISISKAAKFLQVSPDTLRNWEKQGKLLPSRTYGGARRYSTTELLGLKKELRPFVSRRTGLVSISTVAKALRVSSDTIRNWDKKGLIESSRSRGGARRFTRDEIIRLQKELGLETTVIEPNIEFRKKEKIIPEPLKSSHEVHNFTTAWLKITFPIVLITLILIMGWFLGSLLDPLEKRLDDTTKLITEIIQSIEGLQKGVLGIQTQPTPSPIVLPSNLNIQSANPQTTVVFGSAKTPLNLNSSTGQISCSDCLTVSSTYISSVTNSDGALGISLNDKEAKISLNMDHTNIWKATQSFQGGMIASGNVGIGWTSPINKLEVAGGQTIGTGYAGAYAAPANGLIVEGNVGIGISAPSYHLDVAGGARFGCGNNNWNSGPATDCSDIAEGYESDGSVDIGEIVVVGSKPNVVSKSSTPYQKGIIGIYSTSPGILVGGQTILGGTSNLADNQIPVALAGRVPVKVSDENGPIHIGDFLTSSSIPGVAMKATKIGPAVGQALEPFDVVVNDSSPSGSEDTHLIQSKINFKTILVFVNVTFADPNNFLASLNMDDQGNLIIPKIKVDALMLDVGTSKLALEAGGSKIESPSSSFQSHNLASSILSPSSSVFYDLSGKIASIEDRIAALESKLSAVSPPAGRAGYQSSDEITEASTSAILAESTTSAQLADAISESSPSSSLIAEDRRLTTTDLNLTPPDILLATPSALLANTSKVSFASSDVLSFEVSEATVSGMLAAYSAQIQDHFQVLGQTTLSKTLIAGDLTVDGTLTLTGSSLNTLGTLFIQNGPLAGNIDFFNGLVTIDKLGNLRAQIVTVAEFRVVANKISGSGKINTGTKSVYIENPLVKSSSRILITPTLETDFVLAVVEKAEGKKFTVATAKEATKDIVFDWFMVNESDLSDF